MKDKKTIIIVSILAVLLIVGIAVLLVLERSKKKEEQERVGSTVSDIDIEINTDDGDEKNDWSKYSNEEISLSKSMDITKGGIYTLTGSIKNGYVKVDTEDNVKLILNNVSIKNNNGPAIMVANAENVIIELKNGTTNTLEDSSEYKNYDEDVKGVIYSKSDLIFLGDGTLKVKANYKDGIVSKDDLKILNGTYEIEANDDGIRGKDSVYILDGNFTIKALGDGIKSTNDSKEEKGFILIEKGTFNIDAGLDAIQACTKLLINDGTFNIKTDEGSQNSSKDNQNWGVFGKGGMEKFKNPYGEPGDNPGVRPNMKPDNIPDMEVDMQPNNYPDVKPNRKPNQDASTNNNQSAKGLKAGGNLVIKNGTFIFDTADDAIHSNSYVGITNGVFKIASGDDGMHADTELIIDSGNIDITKSYEGVESAKITINGGTIKVVASDDGINVAGGADSSSMGRPGANSYNEKSDCILIINDGDIYVNASGDGIDVNGSGYVYGGKIIVEGPEDNGNGVLDYDGEFLVNGGEVVAIGSSGMLQSASEKSKQYNIVVAFGATYNRNKVTIENSSGNEVMNITASKNFAALVYSSDKLKKGESYTIKVDGEEYETFKISSITTKIGNINYGGMGGNNRPNGGGRESNQKREQNTNSKI